MVEAIDKSTGEIMAALDRLKLRKRTLVIFTSDNGGYLNYGEEFHNISSNGELRGQKGTLYEGGHRVPLIVSWPDCIKPKTTHELTHSNDLLPTIAKLAGLDTNLIRTDGVELSRLLLQDQPLPSRTLFWRAGNDWAVRDGPWKLVFEQGHLELFDLQHDLVEQNDLSTRKPDTVKRLVTAWRNWNSLMPE